MDSITVFPFKFSFLSVFRLLTLHPFFASDFVLFFLHAMRFPLRSDLQQFISMTSFSATSSAAVTFEQVLV